MCDAQHFTCKSLLCFLTFWGLLPMHVSSLVMSVFLLSHWNIVLQEVKTLQKGRFSVNANEYSRGLKLKTQCLNLTKWINRKEQ